MQSTFLNAFRGLKRGVVPELESAWLFKIAHNVCLSRRRSSWRRGRVESPADFEAIEEQTPAPSRGADELIGLQDVLEQMPESQRRAILLREWQGLSYREIAAELELSQGAVETLIFRARRALATGLEEPPGPTKRRLLRGADLGSLVAGLKALLVGGSGAAKIAAAVAVVSATTVVAADPVVQRQHEPQGSQPVRTVVPTHPLQRTRVEAGTFVAPAAPGASRVTPARHPQRVRHDVLTRRTSIPTRLASVSASVQKQHPAAAATAAANGLARKAAAKPGLSTTPGSKSVRRAVAKGHQVRAAPRHTSQKVKPSAPAPAGAAADGQAQKPATAQADTRSGAGKSKGQTG